MQKFDTRSTPGLFTETFALYSNRLDRWIKIDDREYTPEQLAAANDWMRPHSMVWRPVGDRPPRRTYTIQR